MAYTQSPATQTQSSPTLPAAYGIDLRPSNLYVSSGAALTQDAGMVNLLPCSVKGGEKGEIYAHTRHAIKAAEVANSDLISRGGYVWEKTAGTVYYFTVCGTGVYTSLDAISWTQVDTLLTSATTPVRFTEFINDSNVKSLILVDGVEGYIYTTNAAGVKITDGDFPTPHVPFPVFMDGYLFLAKAATGDIYNSNLNDPTLWTAGDFISSELYPDDVVALLKVNNYILAIGLEGSEFFYDAANPTGTPLARYEGGSQAYGTLYPNAIASNKHQAIILAQNNDGEFIIKLLEDFKAKDASASFLVPVLAARLAAGATAAGVRGYFLRQSGELFYVIAIQGDQSTPSLLNKTFALNLANGNWTELRVGAAGDAPYPVYFVANSHSAVPYSYVCGHYAGTPFFGHLSEAQGATDTFTNGAGAVNIYQEIRTPSIEFGTANLKTMSRFGVHVMTGTSSSGTSGADLTMSISYSDDDYASFSSARNLIFGPALNYPFITQLGQFRQRTFKITYSGPIFLKFKALTFDINKGQQ